jgi:MFS family permease
MYTVEENAVNRPRLTLLAVALATFMTYLDNNIINVAIPAIQRDLQLTTSGLEWVVSSYILVFASLLLAGGRLADVWGRKRLFLIGLSIFTGASLVAGFAGSVDVLVISRAVQGLGAALVTRPRWPSSPPHLRRAGNGLQRLASGAASALWRWRSGRCSAACSVST